MNGQSSAKRKVLGAYDGSRTLYRLLRAFGWGPLLNLGYFSLARPWHLFNLPANQRALVRKMIALCPPKYGESVLDVACGRGASSHILVSVIPSGSGQVVGLDIVPEHVQVAQVLYGQQPNLSFVVGNAETIDCHMKPFSKIFCLEAAFHFNREAFINAARRALLPGGILVVVDFVWKSAEARDHLETDEFRLVRSTWSWDDFATHEEYLTMARRAGFRQVRSVNWSSNVTRAISALFRLVCLLSRFAPTRRLLEAMYPELRGLSAADWKELRKLQAAHKAVNRYAQYRAYVFRL